MATQPPSANVGSNAAASSRLDAGTAGMARATDCTRLRMLMVVSFLYEKVLRSRTYRGAQSCRLVGDVGIPCSWDHVCGRHPLRWIRRCVRSADSCEWSKGLWRSYSTVSAARDHAVALS